MKQNFFFLLLLTSLFTQAQLNFKFDFRTTGGVPIFTTPTYTYPGISNVTVINVDLSNYICEGEDVVIRNLSNGTYSSSTIDNSTLWDGKWGVWGIPPGSIPTWTVTSNVFDNQLWNTGVNSQTVTIPNIAPAGNIYMNSGNDPNYAYHHLLVAPLLNSHYHEVYNSNAGCSRVLVLKMKVKKAPNCLVSSLSLCEGELLSDASLGLESGVTISNWAPFDPRVTAPTTTTNFTYTLSNGTCSYNCSLNLKVLKPEKDFLSDATVCYEDLPFLSSTGVYDSWTSNSGVTSITVNGVSVFDFDTGLMNPTYFNTDEKFTLNQTGVYTIGVTYSFFNQGNVTCTKYYTINVTKAIKINLPSLFTFCNGYEMICGPAAPTGYVYNYQWLGPDPVTMTSTVLSTASCFTPSVDGNYFLTVTNQYGCKVKHLFKVSTGIPMPILNDISVCKNDPMPTISIAGQGYLAPEYSIKWYVNGVLVQNSGETLFMTPATGSVVKVVISKAGCNPVTKTITVTISCCEPTAVAFVENIQGSKTHETKYGPMEIPTVCLPNVYVDGAFSQNENSYFVELAEFDLLSWSDVTVFYSGWVPGGVTAPSHMDVNNLLGSSVSLVAGKVYRFRLAVGPTWHSTDVFFIPINCRTIPGDSADDQVVSIKSKGLNTSQESQDSSLLSSLNLYPNPTKNWADVSFLKLESGSYSIFTTDGRLVAMNQFSGVNELRIDFSIYDRGIYIVQFAIGNEKITKQIIKE
ncbi:T9SS type A sorting domain-containing protein [Flavobacterium sp. J27]|uniref:T9SS type A sorting domain-containing protein n=1 Tax=Flavobacterium sp. J27 TaxID=2060419 RepID=UPI0013EE7F2E|nr:T9SS type A sorting domain-containing protein [Flavobacterium sp. J27]